MTTNKETKSPEGTRGNYLQMLAILKKINETSHQALKRYFIAIDFLENKGLKEDFEDYLLSRLEKN
jgi:hypothetical protein